MADLPYQRDRLSERAALYAECDKSGNGYCSVAEIEPVLRKKYGFTEQEKMPLIHAFAKACNFSGKEKGTNADFIEHGEFRAFLEILRKELGLEVVPQAPAKEDLMIRHPRAKKAAKATSFIVDLPYKRESLEARKKLFYECDPNGNGFCSVAEIDAILRRKYGFGSKQKMDLIHAFNETKNMGGQEKGLNAEYIEHGEFRAFLEVLMKKLGMKTVPQAPAKEDLMINHPHVKKKDQKGKKVEPAKASKDGSHFLHGAKVGSTRGFITVAGFVVAIPHPTLSKCSSAPEMHRMDGVSEHRHHYREKPYCYSSMDKKPLESYNPNAHRNRLALDDAPVPYKNASTIQFSDGIHTCHKRRFLSTNQVGMTGMAPDPRTNTGSIAESNRILRELREK